MSAVKQRGFAQGLTEVSAVAKEKIGTLRITEDGRKFRYAKAGSSALSAGKMAVAPAIMASVTNKACVAADVGTQVLTLTITAPGVALAENHFRGGYFQINDSIGAGRSYPIEGSTAVAAAGTSITISLRPPGIKDVALTTGSKFTLIPSPWMATVESGTLTSFPIGVTPITVPAGYYYWAQTGGSANALIAAGDSSHGKLAAGGGLAVLATPAGSIALASSTFQGGRAQFGRFLPRTTAFVAAQYGPVWLTLD